MFIKETSLLGVRYWIQSYEKVRGFDVYEYLGRETKPDQSIEQDIFYFTHRTNGYPIKYEFKDLPSKYFKPFLINFRAIQNAREELLAKRAKA